MSTELELEILADNMLKFCEENKSNMDYLYPIYVGDIIVEIVNSKTKEIVLSLDVKRIGQKRQ